MTVTHSLCNKDIPLRQATGIIYPVAHHVEMHTRDSCSFWPCPVASVLLAKLYQQQLATCVHRVAQSDIAPFQQVSTKSKQHKLQCRQQIKTTNRKSMGTSRPRDYSSGGQALPVRLMKDSRLESRGGSSLPNSAPEGLPVRSRGGVRTSDSALRAPVELNDHLDPESQMHEFWEGELTWFEDLKFVHESLMQKLDYWMIGVDLLSIGINMSPQGRT